MLLAWRFHGPVYFQNGFGANFEYLLNSANFCLLITFSTFFISYTSNALIDMVEILFSREKVP